MNKLKLSLICLFSVICTLISAQDSGQVAAKMFAECKYMESAKMYEMAASLTSDTKQKDGYYAKAKKSRQCADLLNKANSYYKAGNIAEALKLYRQLLAANSNDRTASARIAELNAAIEKAELQRKEKEALLAEQQRRKKEVTVGDKTVVVKEARKPISAPKNSKTQKTEYAKYSQACNAGTLKAYQDFLKLYPKGEYADDIRGRLADHTLWYKAKSEDTIEAYEKYLNDSEYCFFADAAVKAMQNRIAVDRWWQLSGSTSISAMEGYIRMFPDSPYIADAKKRAHELKAEDYFGRKQLDKAYNEFVALGGRKELSAAQKQMFDECQEYVDFKKLSPYSSKEELQEYLDTYRTGAYRTEVSNYMARHMARNFTGYTDKATHKRALSYAKDSMTAAYVNSQYKTAKKNGKSQRLKAAWDDRWQLGIGVDAEYWNTMVWGPRLELKIGSNDDIFNFSVGGKFYMWSFLDDKEVARDVYNAKFSVYQAPVYASFKFNVANCGSSKFYLAAEGACNFNVKAKYLAPNMSVQYDEYGNQIEYASPWQGEKIEDINLVNKYNFTAGLRLGFSWRTVDFGIYAKYDITPMLNKEYISTAYPDAIPSWNKYMNNTQFRVGADLIYYIIF